MPMRLRIQYEKLGPARFTSHRDVMRIFQRCFSSCRIPVAYSEGFHPHMRMLFSPPLKTGWEGHEEYMDVYLEGLPGEIRDTCNDSLPDGFRIKRVVAVSERAPKIAADIRAATIGVRVRDEDAVGACDSAERTGRIDRLRGLLARSAPVGDESLEPRVLSASVEDRGDRVEIVYTTTMVSGKIVGPVDVLAGVIGDPATFRVPAVVARCSQFVERDGEFVSPLSKGVLLNQS
jgi:radical SAM-linked protein